MRPLRLVRLLGGTAVVVAAVAALAAPAGAQQLVDAGGGTGNGSGAVAFIAFALMVFAIGFSLFFMDRVRRRRSDDDRELH